MARPRPPHREDLGEVDECRPARAPKGWRGWAGGELVDVGPVRAGFVFRRYGFEAVLFRALEGRVDEILAGVRPAGVRVGGWGFPAPEELTVVGVRPKLARKEACGLLPSRGIETQHRERGSSEASWHRY